MESEAHLNPTNAPVLSASTVFRHLRQTVVVIDEVGTILQHLGSSLGVLGYEPGELVGTNAIDHVAPDYHESMMFAFFGPEDRIVRSTHLPFKIGLLDRHGNAHDADCCGERVHVDGRHLWIVTMMPHELQSASCHALRAHGDGASSVAVADTVARSLSMAWDDAFDIRSFLLSEHDGRRFTVATEPGRLAEDEFATRLSSALDLTHAWGDSMNDVHAVMPVSALPSDVGRAALEAGFEVADLAVARLEGQPMLGLLSFAIHEHTFAGNIDVILRDSVRTIESSLRREWTEELLTRAAEQDPLTGLANRSRFADALEQNARGSAVLFIDLDEFKQINDTFGHAVGDAVLVEVAQRISTVCRPGDVVTRMGGDEFAILLTNVDSPGAIEIGQRILEAIAAPLPVELGPVSVCASGGLATADAGVNDRVERADLAMLSGKRTRDGRLVVA